MSILNKLVKWLSGSEYLIEKRSADGRLRRGSVRRDGKILWASPRRPDGKVYEIWMDTSEYSSAVLKNRLAVRNHTKNKEVK